MRNIGVLKSGCESEDSIQKVVMQWVRLHPKIRNLIFHIPNEGKRSPSYGKRLKDMGMRAGISDLFIAMGVSGFMGEFHGCWIELKSKNGRISLAQKMFMEDMWAQGYCTKICYSSDETISFIKRYCNV